MQVALHDDSLGTLELGCYPFVVMSLQIGSPAVRSVVRNRSLASGAYDDTRYLGPRAVTVNCRLNNRGRRTYGACSVPGQPSWEMQQLIDAVVPYMSPRLRPTLSYQLPGSTAIRSMTVRGESWPVAIEGPKYPVLPLQFVNVSGEIFSGQAGDEECLTIEPAGDVETGREYDLDFDRSYPPGASIGARIVTVDGTAPAHWRMTVFGAATDPEIVVNDQTIRFDQNGGLTLTAGNSVVIDTRDRTILLNGDPAFSEYDKTNYDEWTWDELRFNPGENTVRFSGDSLGVSATLIACWKPTWLA